jgi:nucleoside-diphosphate-sugar epimerase
VRRLIALAGCSVEPDVRGEGVPPGEIDRQFLDSTTIRTELGWAPKVELDEGLRRAWDWYRLTAQRAQRGGPRPQR